MNEQEIRQVKAKAQRLETILTDLQQDVELLDKSGVDVSGETEIANRQTEAQDELEQVISDLLLLLDMSGSIEREDGSAISLPNPQRSPINDGDLPAPSGKRPEERGAPLWAKNSNKNNGQGNGN